ncbi:siderophore ABC transporter substrate-binding protein [Paenibacillus melissococcoides]|uniref:Siderophore ABC transporter substrate-binding protein n=1 Tax=Paenibacillus melissococcoides TaxID=2912268 RepID=A0ABN8UA01_9BACL|nr:MULTISPECIES: siderophore ABC transporter substrate-binding protein [Paenibacillus]MEB9893905.1 siderophore ABC transporter substrate-binding protein [Bacillus cereus]CAH8247956.1 siderophore ABC transporter substrate-binding protein [Paenibacillus melissococcoides]CAH8719040.1 siderophore ABC transporter substrate-binding protein [Paenibacillus melissococcoides]CAH8720048.1 siderophore ABC transporter substrate-binding protein [Paenibacillus melissococcoides]GIO80873.1 putative ABC transpo
MKKTVLILVIAMMATLVAACGSNKTDSSNGSTSTGAEANNTAEEIVIKHELGETPVKKNPSKVVVFSYGVVDSLDKLGIDIAALPKNNLPPYLKKFEDEKYVNAGGLKEPDFETIHGLKPDLIIIAGRQASSYEEFKEIAPTIYMDIDTDRYMESFKENAETIGKIFGKESEVQAELAKIDTDIKQLNEKVTAANKNALIILANDGKISAYGANSRFGIIHDVFGFPPVDPDIKVSTHGDPVSFEYIVEKDPDYLFVIDRGAVVGGESSAKQVVENELVMKTKAYKEGHIVYLDPSYWYLSGGGLISVEEMVKEVGAAIQ